MAEGVAPDIIDSSSGNNAETEAVCLSTPSSPAEIRISPFREAQDELLSALGKALPYAPLEHVLSTCIDLYMQWEFPTGPVICEPMDYDVEHPESSSVIIRYFHSNALHALGKTRVSWHVMGEALRLVQEMRLYDETSFGGLEWPEAQLRRNAFWHLYIGDKSASILQKVPISLHQMCLDTPITTIFDENMACGLMDSAHDSSNVAFEDQLRVGFYLCFRLWYTASEMLIDLNLLTRLQNRSSSAATTSPDTTTLRSSIMQSYFDFTSILHNCPPWIRDPSSSTDTSTNEATARFRTRSFATQKANLFVTLHALRLVLLCRFADRGFAEILGLTNDPTMLSLRKVEIASDLLEIVTELPFEALQANGEPCVEKLRQVGVALLEIIHSVTNDAISARAKSLFGTLLDILARLNSRVSDELSNDR
ncbi:hypothetical protein K4K53_004501 [Colletotrichum sp. SAR 10_77]|nr:hypothetical protein K4K53_004501 [Colletotrichum sp. SAR 10_77]